jgi:hypothetical protein
MGFGMPYVVRHTQAIATRRALTRLTLLTSLTLFTLDISVASGQGSIAFTCPPPQPVCKKRSDKIGCCTKGYRLSKASQACLFEGTHRVYNKNASLKAKDKRAEGRCAIDPTGQVSQPIGRIKTWHQESGERVLTIAKYELPSGFNKSGDYIDSDGQHHLFSGVITSKPVGTVVSKSRLGVHRLECAEMGTPWIYDNPLKLSNPLAPKSEDFPDEARLRMAELSYREAMDGDKNALQRFQERSRILTKLTQTCKRPTQELCSFRASSLGQRLAVDTDASDSPPWAERQCQPNDTPLARCHKGELLTASGNGQLGRTGTFSDPWRPPCPARRGLIHYKAGKTSVAISCFDMYGTQPDNQPHGRSDKPDAAEHTLPSNLAWQVVQPLPDALPNTSPRDTSEAPKTREDESGAEVLSPKDAYQEQMALVHRRGAALDGLAPLCKTPKDRLCTFLEDPNQDNNDTPSMDLTLRDGVCQHGRAFSHMGRFVSESYIGRKPYYSPVGLHIVEGESGIAKMSCYPNVLTGLHCMQDWASCDEKWSGDLPSRAVFSVMEDDCEMECASDTPFRTPIWHVEQAIPIRSGDALHSSNHPLPTACHETSSNSDTRCTTPAEQRFAHNSQLIHPLRAFCGSATTMDSRALHAFGARGMPKDSLCTLLTPEGLATNMRAARRKKRLFQAEVCAERVVCQAGYALSRKGKFGYKTINGFPWVASGYYALKTRQGIVEATCYKKGKAGRNHAQTTQLWRLQNPAPGPPPIRPAAADYMDASEYEHDLENFHDEESEYRAVLRTFKQRSRLIDQLGRRCPRVDSSVCTLNGLCEEAGECKWSRREQTCLE